MGDWAMAQPPFLVLLHTTQALKHLFIQSFVGGAFYLFIVGPVANAGAS
jgi:hypothetical protein